MDTEHMPQTAFSAVESAPAAEFSTLSASLQWRILDTLFGQIHSLFAAAPAILLCGGLAFARTGAAWLAAWTGVSLAVLAARGFWIWAYHRRPHVDPPAFWLRRFEIGAWVTSVLWSVASIALLSEHDPLAALTIMNVQAGYALAAAVRNSVVPRIALAQVYLILIPAILCCLATGDVFYIIYALLLFTYVSAAKAIVRHLGQQTLTLLVARERMSDLIEQSESSNAQLAAANAKLERLANIDGLTGIANRRSFDASLARCWRQGLREPGPLSLLLLDIDHFKLFNDSRGHQAGDECLRQIARTVEQTARRPEDHVARYGGEEFAVILPDTDAAGATAVAERIRATIAALMIPHPLSGAGFVTASIGVATYRPRGDQHPEIMLALADEALYEAKLAGRNRSRTATRVGASDPVHSAE
jgi:diguanylate cyclase (GGDEF)-like protein